jgi:hypothetical protein
MLAILLSVFSGLLAHVGIFIRGEWHLKLRLIVLGHICVASTVLWILYDREDALAEALQQLARIIGCYLLTLFTSICCYRIFFHPLSKFPGPRLVAITKFWHIYKSRNSTNYLVMNEMYQKYGTVVRTGNAAR